RSRDRILARHQGNLVRGGPNLRLYRRRLHRSGSRRPGRWTAADRPDFRPGGHHRRCGADPSGCRALDLDWTIEPVSGATTRWRSPFVLYHRGGPGTSVVDSRAGGRVPNRARPRADADGVRDLYRHPASGGIVKRLFCDVAHWQRLGMKMESHGDARFAAPAKLAKSRAASGNLPGRGGAGRHWNDKGALRMIFGMRVRGGFLAALIMFGVPVVAHLAAGFVSAPAPAQTVASIAVEGNRRVEVD